MGVEFELKFSAVPAQQEAIRQQYLSTYEQYRMQTTYYDTAGAALSQRHITLRCRMENKEAVCTVKTPLEGYGRGEWDCRKSRGSRRTVVFDCRRCDPGMRCPVYPPGRNH